MSRYEITKTVEAVKLNKRTLRPLSKFGTTIPYGSVVTEVTPDGDLIRFLYLGEYYEAPEAKIGEALRELAD
jgi:hypothetical protein